MPPPHDDGFVGRDTGIDHLVPTDHRLAFGSYDIGGTADKILFQARFVAQVLIFDKLLDFGIGEPALVTVMHFIASDMNIGRRKQGNNLIEHVADKLERFFLTGMECEMLPFSLTAAGDFGIGTADGSSMARHVEFGNDHDVAIGCIGNDLLDLFLGVERSGRFRVVPVTDSPLGSQLRIALDLDTPTRFVGQVPVEHIQAKRRHDIQILFYLFFSKEMAALVEHKTTPTIAGLILYLAGSHVALTETG